MLNRLFCLKWMAHIFWLNLVFNSLSLSTMCFIVILIIHDILPHNMVKHRQRGEICLQRVIFIFTRKKHLFWRLWYVNAFVDFPPPRDYLKSSRKPWGSRPQVENHRPRCAASKKNHYLFKRIVIASHGLFEIAPDKFWGKHWTVSL